MLFNSYAVFIYIVLFVLLFNIIRHSFKLRLLNNIVLIGADLLILLLFVKEHSLIIIAILSLIVFLLGRLMQINKSTAVLVGSLVFVIGLFSVRNYAPLLDMLTNSYFDFVKEPVLSVEKVGLSYILFRFVNFLVESWKRSIKRSDFLTFLSYIFFFPSFLAGPIDTYKNFHYWTGKTTFRYQRELFFAGITRIVIGAAKTLIIVPLVIGYATDFHVLLPDYSAIGALS
ncbi:MAG: hypothetical protein KKA07_04495, partial [Bacteroidetes bacterium]|nr:hypothetical protein [Bacteroidota bacterium]